MLIAQITDMHVGQVQRVGSTTIDTLEWLGRAVDHVNALDPRPDFLVATGDLTADGRPSEYADLARALAPLAMPYTVIPGNHDDREGIRSAFPELTFGDGELLNHRLDLGPLRLLALDTLIPGEGGGELGTAQLSWLETELDTAESRPILIAMHHPPAAVGIPEFDCIGCRDGDALAALLRSRDNVKAVICGHVHRPISFAWAGTALHVTPSTGYQYSLSMSEEERLHAVPESPACRLLRWIPEAGLVAHLSYIA